MLYHCFASFKQSQLDLFKLVDSRLILMLLYDSLNLIISGVHQSHLGPVIDDDNAVNSTLSLDSWKT